MRRAAAARRQCRRNWAPRKQRCNSTAALCRLAHTRRWIAPRTSACNLPALRQSSRTRALRHLFLHAHWMDTAAALCLRSAPRQLLALQAACKEVARRRLAACLR
mmetsp:Transcript_9269/g.28569  ORF Transcript_9269/g.28569 Transcript_9269/m.28569 type:complete len:105 (-) Transcript_9269:137-451(-)